MFYILTSRITTPPPHCSVFGFIVIDTFGGFVLYAMGRHQTPEGEVRAREIDGSSIEIIPLQKGQEKGREMRQCRHGVYCAEPVVRYWSVVFHFTDYLFIYLSILSLFACRTPSFKRL